MGSENEALPLNEATVTAAASVENSKFVRKTLQDFEVLSVIRNGCFGTCYKVRDKATDQLFVWKGLDYEDDNELGAWEDALRQEIGVLRQLQHPNIMQHYHYVTNAEAKTLYVVMECCGGGNLGQLIATARSHRQRFEEHYVWRVLIQLCGALQLCHAKLHHCDVKPANVFLDNVGNAKLSVFGLARIFRRHKSYLRQTFFGTSLHISTELDDAKCDGKSAVGELGSLVYELCTLRPPIDGDDCVQLATTSSRRIPAVYSADLQAMVAFLRDSDPQPRVEDILQHPAVMAHNSEHLANEFPHLLPAENGFFGVHGDGIRTCSLLQYDLSCTYCSNALEDADDDTNVTCVGGPQRLSVTGVFTPDLRKELFHSTERALAKTALPEFNSELHECAQCPAGAMEPALLTQQIFDQALQKRLHSIRAQECVLAERERVLNTREAQLNDREKRLLALELSLQERQLKAKVAPKPPPPIPPRKPPASSHDDTYCSIEPNDTMLQTPTVARLNMATLPPAAQTFPVLRKVSFQQSQSPKKFITYDIENKTPVTMATTSSVSSKGSDDSNDTISTQQRRKSILSIFGLQRASNAAKNGSLTAKAAPATKPPRPPALLQKAEQRVLAKCETSDLSNMWTKEHKRAAFDLLAAMNAGGSGSSTIGSSSRHKLRQSMRERNLQRNRMRRSLMLPPPQSSTTEPKMAISERREHIVV